MTKPIDWKDIFTFDASPVELFMRGSVIYLVLFVLLRVILKRQAGSIGITDLLHVVLLGAASQNAMAGTYKTVPEGIALIGTLIF